MFTPTRGSRPHLSGFVSYPCVAELSAESSHEAKQSSPEPGPPANGPLWAGRSFMSFKAQIQNGFSKGCVLCQVGGIREVRP